MQFFLNSAHPMCGEARHFSHYTICHFTQSTQVWLDGFEMQYMAWICGAATQTCGSSDCSQWLVKWSRYDVETFPGLRLTWQELSGLDIRNCEIHYRQRQRVSILKKSCKTPKTPKCTKHILNIQFFYIHFPLLITIVYTRRSSTIHYLSTFRT